MSLPSDIPTVHAVYASTGCVTQGLGVIDCPTAGGIELTMRGAYFAVDIMISIAGSFCPLTRLFNSTHLACNLPPG